jgi:hypothetical protein
MVLVVDFFTGTSVGFIVLYTGAILINGIEQASTRAKPRHRSKIEKGLLLDFGPICLSVFFSRGCR